MLNRLPQTDINTFTPQHPSTFLSCDWGISSFRLTLAELPSLAVLGRVRNGNGVSATFRMWRESGGNEAGRVDFFLAVIRDAVAEIERSLERSLVGVPVVISGMASASIGMINLPYGELPFAVDGRNLTVHRIEANAGFPHQVLVVSGIRSADDVMRGEETQLIGSVRDNLPAGVEHLYLLPGTHSKHVRVVERKAISFRTYMTGEFFELLSSKSILADSVASGTGLQIDGNLGCFIEGVTEGSEGRLLNSAFHVRTKALFGQHTSEMNYYFLSGLLIGAEVGGLAEEPGIAVTITGSDAIVPYYHHALRSLGMRNLSSVEGGQAILQGQARILQGIGLTS